MDLKILMFEPSLMKIVKLKIFAGIEMCSGLLQ